MRNLCDIFDVAVVITNQVVTDHGAMVFPKHLPWGDEVVSHGATTQIYLREGSKNCRIAKIRTSPSLPEDECQFHLSDEGIVDY